MLNAIFSNGQREIQENFDSVQEVNDRVYSYSNRGFLSCKLTTEKASFLLRFNGESWESLKLS